MSKFPREFAGAIALRTWDLQLLQSKMVLMGNRSKHEGPFLTFYLDWSKS